MTPERDELLRYVNHDPLCTTRTKGSDYGCSCGLQELLTRPEAQARLIQAARKLVYEFHQYYDGPGHSLSCLAEAVTELDNALPGKAVEAQGDDYYRDLSEQARAASDKLDRAGYYDEATLVIQLLQFAERELSAKQPQAGAVDALTQIKALVCGEAMPNWENTPRTTGTRGRIADICDVALQSRPSSERERINTPCPACGFTSLFIANGGWLTCSRLECKDPTLINDLAKREGFVRVPMAVLSEGRKPPESSPDDHFRAGWRAAFMYLEEKIG